MKCPACDKSVSGKQKICECGWLNEYAKKFKKPDAMVPEKKNHFCAYFAENKQCDLPGSLCAFPYSSGPWYCEFHFQNQNDSKKSIEFLSDYKVHDLIRKRRREGRNFLERYLKNNSVETFD